MFFHALATRRFACGGVLSLLLAASLAGCSPPADKAGTTEPVTLPATAEARDSVQAALTAPAPDAASTAADSTAARSSVTPR